MSDRYFVETPIVDDQAKLAGPEAHHLMHVMRAKPGDEVLLFDGSGAEAIARVERVGRAEIELTVLARRQVDRELPLCVTLGVALPKGDRGRWLVEKATELGIARLVPLATERGNDRHAPEALGRLRRTVIEASKQCGRNRLMQIAPPARLDAFLAAAPPRAARLIAQPGSSADGDPLVTVFARDVPPEDILLAIGPEGGFSDAEFHAALAAGWNPVDLGPRILRVETAAIALTCAVITRWQQTQARGAQP
jgi:16S rRNA (uracil1498-N3)-methyltransferase